MRMIDQATWETVEAGNVLTPSEVFQQIKDEGFRVNYLRLPMYDPLCFLFCYHCLALFPFFVPFLEREEKVPIRLYGRGGRKLITR